MADRIPVSHVGVRCSDPLRVEQFYSRHFGFRRARVYAPGPDQVVMLKGSGIYLELFKAEGELPGPAPAEAGPKYPCYAHLCFSVEDLDAKLRDMGGDAKLTLGPLDMSAFIPGMRVCWVADPSGNIVELNQGYVDEENPPPLVE